MMAQQLEPIPDGPEFEDSLFDQAEAMLVEINVREKPSSVSKLYEWTVVHPGPQAAAAAVMAVRLRTKIQGSPPEKRLSLLYALHELFRRASKDLERDFDYAAWEDAVRAVVPWAFRKQNEADKLKINKSVLKTWVNSGWLSKDFVESLIPGRGTPKKTPPNVFSKVSSSGNATSGGGGKETTRRRRSIGGTGGNDSAGGAAKRQRTSSGNVAISDGNGGSKGGPADPATDRDRASSAPHAMDISSAGYSPVSDGGGTGGVVSREAPTLKNAQLPVPSGAQRAEADAYMAAAATKTGRGGGVGSGAGEGEGGLNAVTPSPEENNVNGTVPDAGGSGEGAQELQRKALSLKLDGCGLIRRIGKAMKFPVRVMLTAYHLFHHYQWCGSVASFRFPPGKLPAVCLACLLAATKAEDCNAKLETLLQQMRQLEPILPPLEGIFPLGQRPSTKEVIDYEYRVLLSRGFDLEMVHPTEHLATLLTLTGAPLQLGDLAYEVLCSRVYTDSTLCLDEDPLTCLCAAVQFSLLSLPPAYLKCLEGMSSSAVDEWPMLYGATKADLLSYTERLVQCARDLAEIAPGQTFMIPRPSDPDFYHTGTVSRSISMGGGFPGAIKSPHPAGGKTPDRVRKRGGSGGGGSGSSGGGHYRSTPPATSSMPGSRPKGSVPCSSARLGMLAASVPSKVAVTPKTPVPAKAAPVPVKSEVSAKAVGVPSKATGIQAKAAAVPAKAPSVSAKAAAVPAKAASVRVKAAAVPAKNAAGPAKDLVGAAKQGAMVSANHATVSAKAAATPMPAKPTGGLRKVVPAASGSGSTRAPTTVGTTGKGVEGAASSKTRTMQKQQQQQPQTVAPPTAGTLVNTEVDMDMDMDSSPEAEPNGLLSLQQGLREELARQRRAAEAARQAGVQAGRQPSTGGHDQPVAFGAESSDAGGHGASAVERGVGGAALGRGRSPAGDTGKGSAIPGAGPIGAVPSIVHAHPYPIAHHPHHQPPQGAPVLTASGQHLVPPPMSAHQHHQADSRTSPILAHPSPSLPPVQQPQQPPPPIHRQQVQQLQQPPPVLHSHHLQPGHHQPPALPQQLRQQQQLQQQQQQHLQPLVQHQQHQQHQLLRQQPQHQPQQLLLQPPPEHHPGPGYPPGVGSQTANPPVSPPVPPLMDMPQQQVGYHQNEHVPPVVGQHAQGAYPLEDTENSAAVNDASGGGGGGGGGHFLDPMHEPPYLQEADRSRLSSAGPVTAPDGGGLGMDGVGGVQPYQEEDEEGVPYRQSSPTPAHVERAPDNGSVVGEAANGQSVQGEHGKPHHVLPPLGHHAQHQHPPHFPHQAQRQPHREVQSDAPLAAEVSLPPGHQQPLHGGDYGAGNGGLVCRGGSNAPPAEVIEPHLDSVEATGGQHRRPWQQQPDNRAWGPGSDVAPGEGDASYLEEVLAPQPVQAAPGSLDHDGGGWERSSVNSEGWLPR